MSARRLVSVIIPTYNRAHSVKRAARSVLAQSHTNLELLIVDDCSQDNTEEIVRELNDSRVHYIRHLENRGGSAARNSGIRVAQGDYIAFLDSDDTWLPDKLSRQINLFQNAGGQVGVTYTGFTVKDNGGQILDVRIPRLRGDIFRQLLCANWVGTTSTVMMRRDCFAKQGLFDETLPSCQDWDMWIRLARDYEYDYIPEPLVDYIDAPATTRITGNISAMIAGHESVLHKFRSEMSKLSTGELALQQLNLGRVFASAGATRHSRHFFAQAIRLSPPNLRALTDLAIAASGPSLAPRLLRAKRKMMLTLSKLF